MSSAPPCLRPNILPIGNGQGCRQSVVATAVHARLATHTYLVALSSSEIVVIIYITRGIHSYENERKEYQIHRSLWNQHNSQQSGLYTVYCVHNIFLFSKFCCSFGGSVRLCACFRFYAMIAVPSVNMVDNSFYKW